MNEWLIYVDADRDSWAMIVSADTPEAAVEAMGGGEGIVVLPVEAVTHVVPAKGYDVLDSLRGAGRFATKQPAALEDDA